MQELCGYAYFKERERGLGHGDVASNSPPRWIAGVKVRRKSVRRQSGHRAEQRNDGVRQQNGHHASTRTGGHVYLSGPIPVDIAPIHA